MGSQRNNSLDGVRALSALAVLLMHTHVPLFERGGFGVQVFFVLSGYLITSLLVAEIDRTGSVAFWPFMLRRVRRLVPALVVVVALTTALTPLLLPVYEPLNMISALLALTYTTNLGVAVGLPWAPLAHTWSLAVEMQFYLVWPILIQPLLRLSRLAAWLFVGWAGLFLLRSGLAGTISNFSGLQLQSVGCLLLGAMVALLPAANGSLAWVGAAMVLVATFVPGPAGDVLRRMPLLDLGSALMVSALRQPSSLSRALSWPPLTYLGLISYGIYLWHAPFARFFNVYGWQVSTPIVLALSLALAALSYATVETWAKTLGRGREVRMAAG